MNNLKISDNERPSSNEPWGYQDRIALMCPQADHLLSVPIMNLEDGVPVVCHIILEHSENEKNSENVPNILCRSKQKKSRPSKFVLSVTWLALSEKQKTNQTKTPAFLSGFISKN